jgi:hypothetical protein
MLFFDLSQVQNQAPAVLNHSSEPEWLFGPKPAAPAQPPVQSNASNPSWLSPKQQEMVAPTFYGPTPTPTYSAPTLAYSPPASTNPFASPPPPQPGQAQNVTFNPFD